MDDFTKNLILTLKIDPNSEKKTQEVLKKLSTSAVNADEATDEAFANLDESLKQHTDTIEDTNKQNKKTKQSDTELLLEGISEIIGDTSIFLSASLGSISKSLNKFFVSFDDVKSGFDEILEYSYLTDENIRNLKFMYGLDDAEAYATQKALDFVGVSSLEDLAAFGTELQKSKFLEKFEEYTDKYNSLYDEGTFDVLQEFNWALAEIKDELVYDAMELLVDNKDVIVEMMKAVIDIADDFLQVVDWLVNSFSTAKDYFKSAYSAYSSTYDTNINQNIYYAYTGQIGNENAGVALGQALYEAVVTALNGGKK